MSTHRITPLVRSAAGLSVVPASSLKELPLVKTVGGPAMRSRVLVGTIDFAVVELSAELTTTTFGIASDPSGCWLGGNTWVMTVSEPVLLKLLVSLLSVNFSENTS